MLGVTPRVLARRIRRLSRRMQKPEFAFVALHRSHLDAHSASVADLCVIEGLSERACAARLGVSVYAVRRSRQSIAAMAQSLRNLSEPRA